MHLVSVYYKNCFNIVNIILGVIIAVFHFSGFVFTMTFLKKPNASRWTRMASYFAMRTL